MTECIADGRNGTRLRRVHATADHNDHKPGLRWAAIWAISVDRTDHVASANAMFSWREQGKTRPHVWSGVNASARVMVPQAPNILTPVTGPSRRPHQEIELARMIRCDTTSHHGSLIIMAHSNCLGEFPCTHTSNISPFCGLLIDSPRVQMGKNRNKSSGSNFASSSEPPTTLFCLGPSVAVTSCCIEGNS